MRIISFVRKYLSLSYSETVLFIGYYQSYFFIFNAVLYKCMSSDNNISLTVFYFFENLSFFLCLLSACKQNRIYPKRLKYSLKAFQMLCRKHLCRCHHNRLKSVFDRRICRRHGNCGFSAADISLNKPVHNLSGGHILSYFVKNLILCIGKGKG